MKLELLYRSAEEAIRGLDLARIWPGFAPLKFALFDAERCFFDGQYVEKTDDFCANTAISYQGETIATWRVEGELSLPVLVSKLVHEMFHGFQRLQGWDCWADELEALNRYEYSAEALSLKLRENALLCALLAGHRAGETIGSCFPTGAAAGSNIPMKPATRARWRRSKAPPPMWNGWSCSSWTLQGRRTLQRGCAAA